MVNLKKNTNEKLCVPKLSSALASKIRFLEITKLPTYTIKNFPTYKTDITSSRQIPKFGTTKFVEPENDEAKHDTNIIACWRLFNTEIRVFFENKWLNLNRFEREKQCLHACNEFRCDGSEDDLSDTVNRCFWLTNIHKTNLKSAGTGIGNTFYLEKIELLTVYGGVHLQYNFSGEWLMRENIKTICGHTGIKYQKNHNITKDNKYIQSSVKLTNSFCKLNYLFIIKINRFIT